MKNAAGQRTVIPLHGKAALKRKTVKAILADADLTVEEFLKLP